MADNSGTIKETLLDDIACEFPRTDDRLSCKAYRHGYAVGTPGADMLNFNHLIHFDRQTGARQLYAPGESYMLGEPVFAPRQGASEEADGYVVMLGYDQSVNKSELMIFDAQSIAKGPIARAKVPMRIPAGFHGSWLQAG